MKIHTGILANPVEVLTHTAGTLIIDHDGSRHHDNKPSTITRRIRRMYGLSIGRLFLGVMRFEAPRGS